MPVHIPTLWSTEQGPERERVLPQVIQQAGLEASLPGASPLPHTTSLGPLYVDTEPGSRYVSPGAKPWLSPQRHAPAETAQTLASALPSHWPL